MPIGIATQQSPSSPPAGQCESRSGSSTPIRISGGYLIFGFLWIWLSDSILFWLPLEGEIVFWMAALKGSVFILLSSLLIYWLARREFLRIARINNLLLAVTEGTTDAVFVKDIHGRYLLVNQAAAGLVGKPVSEVLGRDDTALFDTRSAQVVRDRDRRVMSRGEPETEDEVLTASGITRTYQATKAPYRDEKGEIIGVIGISRDISDRIQFEEALQSEEERLRLALECAHGGVWDFNLQTGLTLWSGEMYDLWGIPPGTVIKMGNAIENIVLEDRRRVQNTVAEAVQQRSIYKAEFRIQHPVRGLRWVVSVGRVILDESGQPVRLLGITLDITERKITEVSLRESERFNQRITDFMPGILYILDIEQRQITHLNKAAETILGYPKDQLQTHFQNGLVDIMHPDDLVDFEPTMMKLAELADGEVLTKKFRLKPVDGTWKWFSSRSGIFQRNPSGSIKQIIGTITDINDLKNSEAVLRESEERYRQLMSVLPSAVFVHNGMEVTFCNSAFVRLMGATTEADLLGLSPYQIAQLDYHSIIQQRMESMKANGKPASPIEMHVVRRDGRPVPVYSVTTPFPEEGRLSFLVVLSDLTERERSMGLLRSVLDSVVDAILTVDEKGIIVLANGGMERLFGWSLSEVLGENIKRIVPESKREGKENGLVQSMLEGGTEVSQGMREFVFQRKDGTTFPGEFYLRSVDLGGVRHFTGVIRDVTERKRLEEQFHQSQKMEAIGRLAGGVAHDFNNLLTVINGYSDLLLSGKSEESSYREMVSSIRDAGERASRLTQQLLAFSRKALVEPRILDLNDLLTSSTKLLRRLIGEDIFLSMIPGEGLGTIQIDPGQLEQVIMNLAVNARDAMPTGGRLIIQTQAITLRQEDLAEVPDLKPGCYAKLIFADSGQGMSEEVRARIFEPFFTTKGLGKGTGLGLAVVHGVIKQCGGHISVESTPGSGTTFQLLFPVVNERVEVRDLKSETKECQGTESILLVEDDDAVRTIAKITLESRGYRVLVASGGKEAIKIAEEHQGKIDLLVTDVVMPEIGGRVLADRLRKIRTDLRVLFMSGYTDDALFQQGVVENNDAFLQKPFTPLVLVKRVRKILDGNKAG